jgi:hypothetical protein
MPYTINWYIENEIIYIQYEGETTSDELRHSLLDIQQFINDSPRALVHVLTDVGDVTDPVPIRDTLQIVREVGAHDRMGWQITLREDSVLMKMGIAFGTTIFKTRARTFDTMDEAAAFLKTMDEDIHWENANPSLIIK